MEIQALKLFVTDADLAGLLARYAPETEGIEDLVARFTPEGVILAGRYPTPFFPVTFETTWQVLPAGPELRVRLGEVKVLGLPGNVLRGALMKMVRDNVEGRPGIRVEDDAVVINVGVAARAEGTELDVRFTAVRLSIGAAVIEAGQG